MGEIQRTCMCVYLIAQIDLKGRGIFKKVRGWEKKRHRLV